MLAVIPYVKLAFGCVLCCVFPIMTFAIRNSFDHLVFANHSSGEYSLPSMKRLLSQSLGISGISVLTGILVTHVGVAFGFTGSIAAVLIMYIFPPLFYLNVRRPPGQELVPWKHKLATANVYGGIFIMVLCTGVTVYGVIATP